MNVDLVRAASITCTLVTVSLHKGNVTRVRISLVLLSILFRNLHSALSIKRELKQIFDIKT